MLLQQLLANFYLGNFDRFSKSWIGKDPFLGKDLENSDIFGGKVWTNGKRPYLSLLTREIVSRKIGRPYFTLRIHNYPQSELLHP